MNLIFVNSSKIQMPIKHLFVLVCWFAGAMVFQIPTTYAQNLEQNSKTQDTRKEQLASYMIRSAKELLIPYLPESDFHITVDLVTSDQQPASTTPYLPKNQTAGSLSNLSKAQLRMLAKTIQLKVAVAKTYSEESKQDIRRILVEGLQLRLDRGDSVTFTALSLTRVLPEEKALVREANQNVSKLQGDLRSLEERLGTLARERDDLKKELTQSKSDLQKAYQELTVAKTTPPAPRAEDFNWQSLVQKHAGTAAIAVMVAGGLMLIALGFWSLGRSLKQGAGTLGQSLESLRSLGQSAANATTGTFTLESGNQMADSSKGSSLPSLPGASLDAMYERLMVLHQELTELRSDQNSSITLKVIAELAGKETTVGKAVATLELLGKNEAKQIFDKLGLQCQESIVRFLRTGSYDRPKAEIMLAAGEDLKTKLVVNMSQDSTDRGRQLSDTLLQLDLVDLQTAAIEMDPSLLPRYFRSMSAKEVSQVIQGVFNRDKERFRICAELLPKIPEVEPNASEEDELKEFLSELIKRNSDDIQRPYLRFYQEIAESLDEDATELLVTGLAGDERVSNFVSNHVVTISMISDFEDSLLRELIAGLSASEITALAAGIDQDVRDRLLGTLEGVRATVVAEDVQRLLDSGQNFIDAAFKQVKPRVTSRIKAMKQSGLIGNKSGETQTDQNESSRYAA